MTRFGDGFTGGVRGVHTPLALARWGAGGCYFEDKAGKYERHNEIHVIVMICHTVAEYHMFDIFITANCFSPLDV